jgi:hypothetical protein
MDLNLKLEAVRLRIAEWQMKRNIGIILNIPILLQSCDFVKKKIKYPSVFVK